MTPVARFYTCLEEHISQRALSEQCACRAPRGPPGEAPPGRAELGEFERCVVETRRVRALERFRRASSERGEREDGGTGHVSERESVCVIGWG